MNLPDINDIHPQNERPQFYQCVNCGLEIYYQDEYIEHAGNSFCEMSCVSELMIKEGNAVKRIAGE